MSSAPTCTPITSGGLRPDRRADLSARQIWFGGADWHHLSRARGHGPHIRAGFSAYAGTPRLRPLDGDTTVAPGITALGAPGHTPGHLCVVLSSGQDRALLLGDAVTCPIELDEPTCTPWPTLIRAGRTHPRTPVARTRRRPHRRCRRALPRTAVRPRPSRHRPPLAHLTRQVRRATSATLDASSRRAGPDRSGEAEMAVRPDQADPAVRLRVQVDVDVERPAREDRLDGAVGGRPAPEGDGAGRRVRRRAERDRRPAGRPRSGCADTGSRSANSWATRSRTGRRRSSGPTRRVATWVRNHSPTGESVVSIPNPRSVPRRDAAGGRRRSAS